MTHLANKRRLAAALEQLAAADEDRVETVLQALCTPDVTAEAYHPVNRMEGVAEIAARLWRPLARAFPDLERRDEILLGGSFQGSDWVAATGQYLGRFAAPLFGIPPTGGLAALRYGEVYRIVEGRIAAGFLHLDFLDLMRQAGCFPLPRSRGAEGLFPAPRGRSGLLLEADAPEEAAASLALVETMIFEGLGRYDRQDLRSMGMPRYWTPDMGWYGPCGIGATRGIGGFQAHHQAPFLHAFPDRVGGNHKARFGDGMFVCSTGWPSVRATFAGEWLGVPPTGKPITMRVMDVWRREGDLLAENWVFIDIPEVLLQAGFDAFAGLR